MAALYILASSRNGTLFSRLDERSVEAHLGAQGEAHAGLPIAICFMSVLERGVVCSRGAVSGEFPWKTGTQRPRRSRYRRRLSQKKAPLHRNIFVAMQQNICYMRFVEVAETHSRLWRLVAMSDTATTTIPSFEPVLKALKDVTGQFQFGAAAREYVERSASRAQESLTKYHDNATSFS